MAYKRNVRCHEDLGLPQQQLVAKLTPVNGAEICFAI